MDNRIVFISGAKGGLGTAVTQRFLASGATVIGASLSVSKADFPDANFLPVRVDFTDDQAVRDALNSAARQFGRLDSLIHVAGAFAGGSSIADTDDATWRQMQDLNLTSAFYVLRAAIPHLRKTRSGRIVAIGSLTAAEPYPNLGAYVIFKAALVTLVRTIAVENKDAGLTANVVLPGTMDTPGNRESMASKDFSKWLKPKDVADLVAWLADENARHITGMAIPIDAPNA